MTPSDKALFILCVTAILYALWQSFVHSTTCRYCGRQNGHEEHCPHNI